MTETVTIWLQSRSGDRIEVVLRVIYNSDEQTWSLDLPDFGWCNRTTEFDMYNAFRVLRSQLEKEGYAALCNGARVNVVPSAMSRSVGGRKAYVVQMGQPSSSDALVDIFEFAEPDQIATVEEQTSFLDKWHKSLGLIE